MGRRLGAALLANNPLTPALPERAWTWPAAGVVNEYEKGNYRTQDNEWFMEPNTDRTSGCRRQGCALWRSALFVAAPAVNFALTVQNGDPHVTASWRREVLPVCPRCHRLLAQVDREGRVLEATVERWYLGHTVGIFESRAADALHGRPR